MSKKRKRTNRNKKKQRKVTLPYRDPFMISPEEWNKVDLVEEEYFTTMRNFYNLVVPERLKVPHSTHILRLARSLGENKYFDIEALSPKAVFSFCGSSEPITPLILIELLRLTQNALYSQNEFIKTHPESILYLPNHNELPRMFILIEEKLSQKFLKYDSVSLNFDDENFLNWLKVWDSDSFDLIEEYNNQTIIAPVINQVNNPKAYKEYLKLKHIMKKIDNFGIIGL